MRFEEYVFIKNDTKNNNILEKASLNTMLIQELLPIISLAWFSRPLSKKEAKELFAKIPQSQVEKIVREICEKSDEEKAIFLSALVVIFRKGGVWGEFKPCVYTKWREALRCYHNRAFKQHLQGHLNVSKNWPDVWVSGFSEIENYLDYVNFTKLSYNDYIVDLPEYPRHLNLLLWVLRKYSWDNKRRNDIVRKALAHNQLFILDNLEIPEDFSILLKYTSSQEGLKEQLRERFVAKKVRLKLSYMFTPELIQEFVVPTYNSFSNATTEQKKELLKHLVLEPSLLQTLSDDLMKVVAESCGIMELLTMDMFLLKPFFVKIVRRTIGERVTESQKKTFCQQINLLKSCAVSFQERVKVYLLIKCASELMLEGLTPILHLMMKYLDAVSRNQTSSIDVSVSDDAVFQEWRTLWHPLCVSRMIPLNKMSYTFVCGDKRWPIQWVMILKCKKKFDLNIITAEEKPVAELHNLLAMPFTIDKRQQIKDKIDVVTQPMFSWFEQMLAVLVMREKAFNLRDVAENVWNNEDFRNYLQQKRSLLSLLEEKSARARTDEDKEKMRAGVKRKMEEDPFLQQVKRQCPEHLPQLEKGLQMEILAKNPVITCPVCLDDYSVESHFLRITQCGHTFCFDCVSKNEGCGICRSKVQRAVAPRAVDVFDVPY